MKFATYEYQGRIEIGVADEAQNRVLPLCKAEQAIKGTATMPVDMLGFVEMGEMAQALAAELVAKATADLYVPLDAVKLLAPIPRPRKNIFCIGKNYVEHVMELSADKDLGSAIPKYPMVFSKPPTSVVGPNAEVKNYKEFVTKLDYEVELALIIGKTGKNISKEQAYDYVFGYTIMNDVSARDWQKNHGQWLLGKGPDTFAPLGPWIVDKAEIGNPHNLNISTRINGELRQNANTGLMIFDIPTLIETISTLITLEAGDIIATGTPAGVGLGFLSDGKPHKLLQPGDEMVLEIEKIGKLINYIEK